MKPIESKCAQVLKEICLERYRWVERTGIRGYSQQDSVMWSPSKTPMNEKAVALYEKGVRLIEKAGVKPETLRALEGYLVQAQEGRRIDDQREARQIVVRINEELNGIEIIFPWKPEREVRKQLGSNGFKYSGPKRLWYARANDERMQFAREIEAKFKEAQK